MHELAVERTATKLPVSLRHLVQFRVAVVLGCSWCVDFGTMLQRLDGLDIDRVDMCWSGRDSSLCPA